LVCFFHLCCSSFDFEIVSKERKKALISISQAVFFYFSSSHQEGIEKGMILKL